jgi:hypothetical protein
MLAVEFAVRFLLISINWLTKLVNPVLTLASQSGTSSAKPAANRSPNLADTVARRLVSHNQIPARSPACSVSHDPYIVGNGLDVSGIC